MRTGYIKLIVRNVTMGRQQIKSLSFAAIGSSGHQGDMCFPVYHISAHNFDEAETEAASGKETCRSRTKTFVVGAKGPRMLIWKAYGASVQVVAHLPAYG